MVVLRILVRHRSFPRREIVLEGVVEGSLPLCKISTWAVEKLLMNQSVVVVDSN